MTYAVPDQINQALSFPSLIEALRLAFGSGEAVTPLRHHHDFKNPPEDKDSTLLLMPSWIPGKDLGVKVVTVSPNNAKYQLPAIHGVYLLFDGHTGDCRLVLDAKTLTTWRTAATSALASSFLSREDSRTLLMVGTGALGPQLIRAHATVRPIRKVLVWGRSKDKADALTNSLKGPGIEVVAETNLASAIEEADIISCATLSESPVIHGKYLRSGQHLDMVGAYRPHMREADDEAIRRSSIFVDHYQGALHETGDLAIPLKEGTIRREDIRAELSELCGGRKQGRNNSGEITFFKSVGHALEDLVAARMVAGGMNEEGRTKNEE